MFNPFKKKPKAIPLVMSREEVRRLAEHVIDVSEPKDLRDIAKAALEKMTHG